jgi:hypothetical protein
MARIKGWSQYEDDKDNGDDEFPVSVVVLFFSLAMVLMSMTMTVMIVVVLLAVAYKREDKGLVINSREGMKEEGNAFGAVASKNTNRNLH